MEVKYLITLIALVFLILAIEIIKKFKKKKGDEYSKKNHRCFTYRYTLKSFMFYGSIEFAKGYIATHIFYKSSTISLIGGSLFLLVLIIKRKELQEKLDSKIGFEFIELCKILIGKLQSGYSLSMAFIEIEKEEKTRNNIKNLNNELYFIKQKLELGISIEEALQEFADESNNFYIQKFVKLIRLSQKAGANQVKIISEITKLIKVDSEIKKDLEILSAEKNFEQKIITTIPFFLIMFLDSADSEFTLVLYTSFAGRLAMTIALIVLFLAKLWAKKLSRIKI